MYSRYPGPPPRPTGEPSYRRPDVRVSLPLNYSGTAFPPEETLPLSPAEPARGDAILSAGAGRPDARDPAGLRPEGEPIPGSDSLPRVSSLGASSSAREEPTADASALPGTIPASEDVPPRILPPPDGRPSPLSALASLLNPAHFPFGHGLGFEELLLLGLILLILNESPPHAPGGGDTTETVLLLALLLLCG